MNAMPALPRLILFTPASALPPRAPIRRAMQRLAALGFDVHLDAAALARHERFGGDDATRLQALHRVADAAPPVALATRGGYGLARLLDAIDWPRLAAAVERGTRWVGYSDLTALQCGLHAHTGAASWIGPLGLPDFGAATLDDVTPACFAEAMRGELEAVGFRTDPGFDGLERRGTLWGGNLCVLVSLLGTAHWPARAARGGILVLEDVGEHPYRVERNLLHLHQAGVLARQRAVLLGSFTGWRPAANDRGYGLRSVVAMLRSVCEVPILCGLPIGHGPTKVCLPFGRRVTLAVAGRDAFVAW